MIFSRYFAIIRRGPGVLPYFMSITLDGDWRVTTEPERCSDDHRTHAVHGANSLSPGAGGGVSTIAMPGSEPSESWSDACGVRRLS